MLIPARAAVLPRTTRVPPRMEAPHPLPAFPVTRMVPDAMDSPRPHPALPRISTSGPSMRPPQ